MHRTVAAQSIILGLSGWLLLVDLRESELRRFTAALLGQNAETIAHRVKQLPEFPDAPPDPDSLEWAQVTDFLGDAPLLGGARLCILDRAGTPIWNLFPSNNPKPDANPGLPGGEPLSPPIGPAGPSASETATFPFAPPAGFAVTERPLADTGLRIVLLQPDAGARAFFDSSVGDAFVPIALAGIGVVLFTIKVTLAIVRKYESEIECINAGLESEVRTRVAESTARLHAVIFGLAKLADYRDSDTGAHLERICEYSVILARALARDHPEIDEAWVANLRLAASLHDIGKVGVPDRVLLKRGPLTPEERQDIRRHPIVGADTLLAVRNKLGDSPLLNMSIEIAIGHHERWDGTGYPFGLDGERIALSARIVAVADVYDALRSARVYKPSMSHEQASRLIHDGSGTQFDPAVVGAFDQCEPWFVELSERWSAAESKFGGAAA